MPPAVYSSHPGTKKRRVKNQSHDFRSTAKPTALGPLARHHRVEDHRSRPPQQLMKVASSMRQGSELFRRRGEDPGKITYGGRFSLERSHLISSLTDKKLSTHMQHFSGLTFY